MTHLGWDIDATAIMITGRIMDLDVQKRTRDAMRAIVVSECERFASQTQDTIEGLERAVEGERIITAEARRARNQARENATDDLADLATVAETHAEAHIETIRMFSKRGIDRFVMARADQREAGAR